MLGHGDPAGARRVAGPVLDGRLVDDLVVVSHDGAEDPVFNYASKAALDLWEMDWETFTSTPSRFSAEPDEREARASVVRRVTEDGASTTTAACASRPPASARGARRLRPNVYDGETRVGQAALFREERVCAVVVACASLVRAPEPSSIHPVVAGARDAKYASRARAASSSVVTASRDIVERGIFGS